MLGQLGVPTLQETNVMLSGRYRSTYTYGTCYDMATYPCIYVYDAPGINPAAFGSYGAGIYIPKLGLVPKHVRPVRPVANLYDLLAS